MTPLSIIIKDKADSTPAWPELTDSNSAEATMEAACILQGGTVGGQAAIGFKIKMADGTHVVAQLTANLLKGLHGALIGAEQRWAETTGASAK